MERKDYLLEELSKEEKSYLKRLVIEHLEIGILLFINIMIRQNHIIWRKEL